MTPTYALRQAFVCTHHLTGVHPSLALQAAPFPVTEKASSNAGDSTVYGEVLAHVEDMFDTIRGALLDYDVTNYIRASLLQPITSLATKQVSFLPVQAQNTSCLSPAVYHQPRHAADLILPRQSCLT